MTRRRLRTVPFRSVGVVIAMTLAVSAGSALTAPGAPGRVLLGISWTHGTDSPFNAARFDGELGSTNGRVYVLGFRTDGDATDGSVWYYDVAAKTYTDTGVDMPVPVSNYEIARLTDKNGNVGLYIFGGRGADGTDVTTTQAYFPDTNTTQNLKADPWPGLTPMGCSDLPATGVAVVGNKAYVMGGISFADDGCADDNSAQTWIFDPTKPKGSKWKQGPSMHVARGYISPTVLNGTIYAIGGDTIAAGSLTPIATVEAFTPPTGKWINKGIEDLPEPCDESQAFGLTKGPLAGGVVLAGCGQWPNALPDTLFYDVAANSWSVIGALTTNRRNFAGVMLPGKKQPIMVLGGYGEDSGFVDPINIAEIGKGTTALGEVGRSVRTHPGGALLR